MSKVIYLSDLHFPFQNKKALKKVLKIIEKERPTHVVQAGDLLDFYSYSRYEKSADFTNPKSELQQGLKQAKEMWIAIKKAAPKAKCYQLLGNHEQRLNKTIARKAPELESITKSIQDLYKFKGVKVMDSDRDHLEIDGVLYIHGHYTKLGDHAKFYRQSVVHGHTHRAGIFYEQTMNGLIWELDCGFLADKDALPLQYTQSKFSKWVTGFGIVENGVPRFIPL